MFLFRSRREKLLQTSPNNFLRPLNTWLAFPYGSQVHLGGATRVASTNQWVPVDVWEKLPLCLWGFRVSLKIIYKHPHHWLEIAHFREIVVDNPMFHMCVKYGNIYLSIYKGVLSRRDTLNSHPEQPSFSCPSELVSPQGALEIPRRVKTHFI